MQLVSVWFNLNSLKAISFKRTFLGCMRNVFFVRQLDILEITFCFRFKVMYLGETNGNLSETKFSTLSQIEKTFT